MASAKRKAADASHDGDEMAKKLKMEDEGLDSQTLQSNAGKFQGFDDDAIEALFEALFHAIKNLAFTSFRGAPYTIPRMSHYKESFERLTSSDYKAYMKSKRPGVKQEIITAVIWNQLVERLLSAPTKAFLNLHETTMKNLALGKLPFYAKRDFYAWRSMTANLLSKSSVDYVKAWDDEGPQRRDFVVDTTLLLFDHMVDQDVKRLERELDVIADKAFQLAQAMACCRAGWGCAMKSPGTSELHGFNIKTYCMEKVELWDEGEEYSKIVDLITVPMLLKRGNNRGGDFGTVLVIKKAQVVMKPKPGVH